MKTNLLFISALLLQSTYGETLVEWKNQDTLFDSLLFKLGYGYEAGMGYRTISTSGVDDFYEGWQFESLGLQIFSIISTSINVEVLSAYRFGLKAKFTPFDMIPYQQWVGYVRPDALYLEKKEDVQEGFDIWLEGTYSIKIAKLSLEVTHHAASIKKSFIKFLMDPNGYAPVPTKIKDLEYNDDYKTVYEDPYWFFDLKSFLQKMGVNNKYNTMLGENITIWSKSLLNRYQDDY